MTQLVSSVVLTALHASCPSPAARVQASMLFFHHSTPYCTNSMTCCTRGPKMHLSSGHHPYFFFGAGFAAGGGAPAAAFAGALGASVCLAAPPMISNKLSPFLPCIESAKHPPHFIADRDF